MKKQKWKKVFSGIMSTVMLANFSTVFPIAAFADDEIQSEAESQNSAEKNGHRYQVFDESMSWTDAKVYCENLGGHLVTINSEEEQKFIEDSLLTIGTKKTYFIGLSRATSKESWSWVTNEPFDYSNWDYGEPNSTNENYVHMYAGTGNYGTWNNTLNYVNGNSNYSTANAGFICEWENKDSPVEIMKSIKDYALFSASASQNLNFYGWKSNINGNIYSGASFNYGGSELYVTGKIDTVGTITANGWKTEIAERNENISPIDVLDLDKVIHDNAQPYEYYEQSPAYVKDKNVISSSIKVAGDVVISGTDFEGDCYIIAEGNITYNVNSFNTNGRVFLYSRNGNITINGTSININGAMYAPKGNIAFNTNETTINGFAWADSITYNGSILNVNSGNFDMIEPRSVVKTYTIDDDFNEGEFHGLSLDISNQLTLSQRTDSSSTIEKIFGDTENGKGVKVTSNTDKSVVSQNGESVNISYGLSGFGEVDIEENAVDLIIVVDESGSMSGSRMTNTKSAAKEIISQMKDNDRCAVIGFTYSTSIKQSLTSDKNLLNTAVDKLYANGGTSIYRGIDAALDMFESMSDDNRQKYIILLSDGEDEYKQKSLESAETAGKNDIRIFSMMIGTGTLQMQNIAINSNGIYKNAPTSEDIGKIMSYFASEVFNVAGRNTTFKTTIKDKNSVDTSKITPEPSKITENEDGSVTLEWNFDRITIDEVQNITIPVKADGKEFSFADLTENTSCVYYDRNGKPNIVYIDDISIPVSNYSENGNWSVIFDSERENVEWENIYWNGNRYGDGTISVSASVSGDGENFSEPISINNYEKLEDISGRYIKLTVDMELSSDGKSPELYDVTVVSKDAVIPELSNETPVLEIASKSLTKVNVPLNIRAVLSDDCLKSDLSIEWSSDNENVKFSDSSSLKTSVICSETGSYDIVCTVNDGEKTVQAMQKIVCEPADNYADIDPDKSDEAIAPKISVDLPEYADRNEKINAEIEKLNDTEISWYSVIFNENTAVNVSDDGKFSLTMPNKDGAYTVVIRAFDWTGKSDVKEYKIVVDSTTANVEIKPSSNEAIIGDEAYFKVNLTGEHKIKTISYTLDGKKIEIPENKIVKIDTSQLSEHELSAEAVTLTGKTISASAKIKIIEADTEKPVVKITPDKSSYNEDTTAVITVTASDNVGVDRIEVFVNGEEIQLDNDGKFKLNNMKYGDYIITANAYDKAGNKGTVSKTVKARDITKPTLELKSDKTEVKVGEKINISVIAADNNGVVSTELTINNKKIDLSDNKAVFISDKAGEYIIKATASDLSKNNISKQIKVVVTEVDTIAPVVEINFDKDTYFEDDDIVISVSATDNVGVTKTILFIDGKEVELDKDGNYIIKNAELKDYEVTAKAYDEENNEGISSEIVKVNEVKAPEINVTFDKDLYIEGDSLEGLITVHGQHEIITLTAKVNGKPLSIEENKFSLSSLSTGDYTFTFTAEDAKEMTSTIEKKVTVMKKDAADRRLYANIDGLVLYQNTAVYKVFASDEINKSTISVTLNGEKITLDKNLEYEFKGEKLFDNEFILTAKTNEGETITVKNTVTVHETDKPIVSIETDKNDGYYDHDDVIITVKAEDISGIKKIMFLYDGVEYPIDENGQVIIKDFVVAPHSVVVKAWDNFGNIGRYGMAFFVIKETVSGNSSAVGKEDNESKNINAKIYSPADEDVITCLSSVIGRADGTEFEKYRLDYAPVNGDYVIIKEGKQPQNNTILGEFDTTMLRNGLYKIRLTVWGKNGETAIDEILVSVEGQMKIGNFSMDFQDMDINVAGLPVTVIRGYDSRDRNVSGDFGYGWNISTCGVKVTTSCDLGKGWTKSGGSYNVNYSSTKPHIVSINWNNGKTEKFRMKITSEGFASYLPVNISFESMDGSGSTLTSTVDSGYWMFGSNQIYDWDGISYNPENWVLKKADGTEYTINNKRGIIYIKDTNKNKITFYTNGIGDSDNNVILYNHDEQGRITSIVSQTGKKVSYEYDENGDLVSVTDIAGNVTKFEYDNHYLTEIIDPRGVTVSRNIYDDDGRLIKTIDADGNEINYGHNIDGREEIITDRNGGITQYIYDHNGNVTSQTDPMGNTITNTYDSNGNLSSKTDAMGNITNYSYDENGNMLSLTDAEGNTVTNSYNSKGFVTSINAMGIDIMKVNYDSNGNTSSTIDALGNAINYKYDSKGNLTSVTDEIGTYINVTYDSKGNVTSTTNGVGTTAKFTYDENGNCLTKTLTYTSEGISKTVTENYTYDEGGNLIQIVDSDGNITSTEYNSIGKISSATDEKGRKTSYDYDDLGNLVKIIYADGTSESFTYDREGNNLTATDRLGRTVTMKYDKIGNLVSKTYPNGAEVKYSYNANYQLISEISTTGTETKYEYDTIGRNTAIIDALGNRTEFAYNKHSQLESMTDAKGYKYTYEYDDNGNHIRTTYPDGSGVSSEYDARGRVTSQSDQYGNTTSYIYDGADRLTGVTDALGNQTKYAYDEVGNLISVTDANGNITHYTYDDFSRVIRTTNALGKTAEVTYDECGNVLTSTDYSGKLTSYTYDEFDRIINKTTSDGTVKYSYTTDGKLSSVEDNSGTTKYTYDGMDGLTKVVYPNGEYVEYSYDDSCRLTSVKTDYGTTKYEYDKLDRLIRVVDRNGYATVYEYDKNGNRTAVKYANGIVISYKYDEVNRLISEKALDKQGGLVAQYEYTLGEAGERTKVKELDRTVDYTYDALYRLTGEKITADDGTVTEYIYAYDKVSNRILKTENGTKTTYTYNAINQLVKENDTVYKYDDAGNLVSTTSSDKSTTYTYNAENKLIRATVQEGNNVSVEEYEYDYAGNRTIKKSENDYTYYLNDSSVLTNVLVELDADGKEKCCYTIGADLVSQERNGNISYYLADGHGSVRQLADSTGKVTDTYIYDAWGNLISSTGDTENSYLYCGEQLDSTTGLYYLRARYMNPSTGTFISMDTYQGSIFDPTSLHKYLYANANPVMYVDPSGYSTENDLAFYQQAWLTIDEAVEYEIRLISSMGNEYSYDCQVMKVGTEIIHKLKNTGIEYALTYVLEPYVGPDTAKLIANGVVSGLDMALSSRNKAVNDKLSISNGENSEEYITLYRGTGYYAEMMQIEDTGMLMSDSMRNSYYNNGGNIEMAFQESSQTHQKWIEIWGNESDFAFAHGEWGSELSSEFGMDRTLISTTTDPEIAKYFATSRNRNGRVYTVSVPRSSVIFQPNSNSGESEVLIKIFCNGAK